MLEAHGITDKEKLRGVSLRIRQGEIVGLAGLLGAGRTELAKVILEITRIIQGRWRSMGRRCAGKLHGMRLQKDLPIARKIAKRKEFFPICPCGKT